MDMEMIILYNEIDIIVEAILSNAKTCAERNGTDEIKILSGIIYRLREEERRLETKQILEQGPGIYIKDVYDGEEPFYDCWRDEEDSW